MRLRPLPDDQWDERARDVLAGLMPPERRNLAGAGNALSTLVRHPDLTATLLPFLTYLMRDSSLPIRLNEMAVLRVARRRHSAYEWAYHAKIASQIGMTEAEIEATGRGEATDELELAVLTAVDEFDELSTLSDQTWSSLGRHLDERQRMDLIFLIGAYGMLATAFNAFGVESDPEILDLPYEQSERAAAVRPEP